jgi:hypothetical protein
LGIRISRNSVVIVVGHDHTRDAKCECKNEPNNNGNPSIVRDIAGTAPIIIIIAILLEVPRKGAHKSKCNQLQD